MNESEIFKAASALPPEKRAEFLQEACGEDAQLRNDVESLLRVDGTAASFLEKPLIPDVSSEATSAFRPISEQPGSVVGPYRLMEQVGEGGFGLVFLAEQQRPVRRKVTLKIIKPGMDTREVIARFEAERQALALMDHPNIAKVLDAGTTDSGRPFFVMELIRGVPIVDYCDSQGLSTTERLKLFVDVCRAVQHAHAKGVIHRDLKPNNILVSPHDGIPVVKVIDFGIAKAMGQQLTDKTIYTRLNQMVGTPLYMSPEQAEINALDVDIRSDVYSLGVLLYELLTGTTPFDRERFSQAAYDEIKRIIREEEPPTPSKRLSTLGDTIATVSKQRNTEPNRLSASLKGELDWIVMCCLEKDRARRYQTVTDLSVDVTRHLQHEPVNVVPPSSIYKLKKMLRRYRVPIVIAVSYIVLSLTGIASTWVAMQEAKKNATLARENLAEATEAETIARKSEEESRRHLESLREFALQQAISETLTGNPARARSAIDMARDTGVDQEWIGLLDGLNQELQGNYTQAIAILEPLVQSTSDAEIQLCAMSALAEAKVNVGNDSAYIELMQRVRSRQPQTPQEIVFVAMAEGLNSHDRTIQLLSDELLSSKYPVVTAILAGAKSWKALGERDERLMAESLADLDFAIRLSGETQHMLFVKQLILRTASEVYRIAGNQTAMKDTKTAIANNGEKLFRDGLVRQSSLLPTLDTIESDEEFFAMINQMDFADTVVIEYAAAPLFRRNLEPEKALQMLDDLQVTKDNANFIISRAHFLAVDPRYREQLLGVYRQLTETLEPSQQAGIRGGMVILALAGQPELLKQQAARFLDRADNAGLVMWGLREAMRCLSGDVTPREVLEFGDVFKRTSAYYALGLRAMAEGRKRDSKRFFEACRDVGVHTFFEYHWSNAYLARMQSNPNWPEWIEPTEDIDLDAVE